ncbi:MAG: type II toxin-antitoxin system VapC family toxin [Thermoproteota archaeon]|nr:type II toxin-antitoxin system VapC family toxin [Thermoproteota archaeon]
MIVIDASILASFLRKEPGWEKLANYIKNVIAVDLIIKEVSNVLWKDYYVRRSINKDTVLELYRLMKSLLGVNILLENEEKYLDDAFEIAILTGVSIYDSLYIAQAKKNKLPLVTLDMKQKEVAEKVGVKVIYPI